MSTRISSAAAFLLLLGACSAETGAAEASDDFIECAVGGMTAFALDCAVERSEQDGTLFLVVRHPDGAFRRFEVLADGLGLAAADGAEPARVSTIEDGIEVAVGADRYRFPATIRGDGAGE
jgi:hypothetical protein